MGRHMGFQNGGFTLHGRFSIICPTSLLPLFLESAHAVAMIRHSMDVVKKAVEHLNPRQTPVVTSDEPLFALAKQIEWKWPDSYGEDHIVVMFGGLHIEMVALKTLGTGCKGVVGCKHLCKPRLRQQGQQTHSFEHLTSCAQEEHIK